MRLITIPISHYCEKARWALDRAGIEYREERHVQGVHQIAARRAGGRKTVPVLVTPGGVLADSAEILAWVDDRLPSEERLFPANAAERAEVEALCRRFDEVLGPRGRRLMYVHMLRQKDLMLEFNNAGVPRWEDRFIRWGWPLVVRFAARELDITPGVEVGDEAAVWEEFDFAGGLLEDGRSHLCGDSFTAADMTFACLAAPALVPPEYTVELPQPDVLPRETAAIIERAREHPAGRHAMAMFRQRRRSPARAPDSTSPGSPREPARPTGTT